MGPEPARRARCQARSMCRARRRGRRASSSSSLPGLRARVRSRGGGCRARCFAPLDPVYDTDVLRETFTRDGWRRGHPRSGATRGYFLLSHPRNRGSRRVHTTATRPVLASALGIGELYLKLDTANPTHSFKDRVVAVAAAKALELGRTTLACSSTGNLANAVAARAAPTGSRRSSSPRRPRAREDRRDRRLRGDHLRRRRELRRLQQADGRASFELDWAFVNVGLRSYYAEGSKTPRVRDRRAAAGGSRRPLPARSPLGRSSRSSTRASPNYGSSRSWTGRRRGCTGPGGGLLSGGSRLRREPQGVAGQAAHRRPLARDRQPGRRRPGRGDGKEPREARSSRSPRTTSDKTWRSSRRRVASSARPLRA